MDVSESGLCLFSPVWLDPKSKIEILIDVPGIPESIVQAEVWHVRREKIKASARKVWVIGAMLDRSDDAYLQLLGDAGLASGDEAVKSAVDSNAPSRSPSAAVADDDSHEAEIVPKVFRIRIQARTGPRTRLLTFTADSADEAQALATRDLEREWRIVEIIAA